MRGFFEIGVYRPKTPENVGTLWRSAYQLGAAGIFVIGRRFPRQSSDTTKTWRHIPCREFDDWEQFMVARPIDAELVCVEMGGKPLSTFTHPERAIYLLGSEDTGIPERIIESAQRHISIEAVRTQSYNVSVAGSLVMYDRMVREK